MYNTHQQAVPSFSGSGQIKASDIINHMKKFNFLPVLHCVNFGPNKRVLIGSK